MIRPFTRERESGSRELFDALAMKRAPRAAAPPDERRGDELVAFGMSGPFNLLTSAHNGISYTVW